jgi:hypothetical protein
MKSACTQNAVICYKKGRSDIGKSWELVGLSYANRKKQILTKSDQFHIVESELCSDLGSGIIERVILAHMTLKDVQTVAAIGCVISPTIKKSFSDSFVDQLDLFLLAYADLLFRQRLFLKRSEVLKCMNSRLLGRCILYSWDDISYVRHAHFEDEFFAFCKQCNSLLVRGEMHCPSCTVLQPRFTCVICRLPVLGIGLSCTQCGHGGHKEHLESWFRDGLRCPAGCDCSCTF